MQRDREYTEPRMHEEGRNTKEKVHVRSDEGYAESWGDRRGC